MPSKESLRIKNYIHVTVLSYFHLQLVSQYVNRKILTLKLVKLDCIILYLDLNTIKKARNKLDGACGLPVVSSMFSFKYVILMKVKKLGQEFFLKMTVLKFTSNLIG